MQSISNRNFGLIVAYLIPGFLTLWGIGFVNPQVAGWLAGNKAVGPTIAGVLYVAIASIGFGMAVSALRWAIIDQIHAATGLTKPLWSDRDLHNRIEAYTWIIENYYRYYQFYGNTLVALMIATALWRSSLPDPGAGLGWLEGSVAAMCVVLFAGSRSALTRYYRRAGDLLGPDRKESAMTNGGGQHHDDKPKKQTKTTDTKAKAGTAANPKKTGK